MKRFRITKNGFIKVATNGKIELYFYRKGDEQIWLEAGYVQVD